MVAAAAPLALGTAATATTAATAGIFGTAGAFSFMQTASVLGTVMSGYSMLTAGDAENASMQSQAKFDDLRSRQELTRGKQEAAQIKGDLARSIASANARGAASGIDITSGSPLTAINAGIEDANQAWTIAKDNASQNSSAYAQNAYISRQRGKNAVRSARTQVAGLATDFMGKQYDRGVTF